MPAYTHAHTLFYLPTARSLHMSFLPMGMSFPFFPSTFNQTMPFPPSPPIPFPDYSVVWSTGLSAQMFKGVMLIRYSTDWHASLFYKVIKWRSKSRKKTGLGPWALVLPWASWTEHSIFAGLKLFIFRIKACFRILIRKVFGFSARDWP